MSENPPHWCVFLPCSAGEIWAIPQNCLAEIVTLQGTDENPPEQISWRDRQVSVLDLGDGGKTPWRNPVGQTGLIAVILGLKGQKNGYWAVALRGEGLALKNLSTERIRDLPERLTEHSTSAFELQNVVYQVPDLPGLQNQAGRR
jgi:hypothetical protein